MMKPFKDIKRTKRGNSYWCDSGAYQSDFNKLFYRSDRLGDIMKNIVALYLELYNNNNENATIIIHDDDGITIRGDISNSFQIVINYLRTKVTLNKDEKIIINELLDDVEDVIKSLAIPNDDDLDVYNKLMDHVIWSLIYSE